MDVRYENISTSSIRGNREQMADTTINDNRAGGATNGIYAICVTILLFIFGQSGAMFFWAGGVSKAQEASKDQGTKLESKVEVMQLQIQSLTQQVAKLQGAQDQSAVNAGQLVRRRP